MYVGCHSFSVIFLFKKLAVLRFNAAERGREMFQETSRRTDLIRFGKYTGTWWEKPASAKYRELFPIPFEQIQASKGSLKQNPGY